MPRVQCPRCSSFKAWLSLNGDLNCPKCKLKVTWEVDMHKNPEDPHPPGGGPIPPQPPPPQDGDKDE